MKLFLNTKKKLLWGRKSHQFECSGEVIPVFSNSEDKSRFSIVLFFKKSFLVLEAKLFQTLLWSRTTCSSTALKYLLSVSTETRATYNLMYRIFNGFHYGTLPQIKEKGIWIVHYIVAQFRQPCRAPLFLTKNWARAAVLRRIGHLHDGVILLLWPESFRVLPSSAN